MSSFDELDSTDIRLDRARPVLFAGAFVTAVLSLTSFLDVYEFDVDEGNNLIKALLVDRGHGFGDIWSDQPPLHTYLLTMVFNLVGWEVAYGRVLTLLFAGLLVFAVYQCARSEFGHVAGCLAGLFLITSQDFVRLSVSIMIGLPSLALAALAAVALLQWSHTRAVRWLLLSGCLMGFSLATKLFTVFLPPIFLLYVLYVDIDRSKVRTSTSWGKPVTAVAIWSRVCWSCWLVCIRSGRKTRRCFSKLTCRPHRGRAGHSVSWLGSRVGTACSMAVQRLALCF